MKKCGRFALMTKVSHRLMMVLFICTTSSLVAQSARAADPVTYLDVDGTTQTCTEWLPVVSSDCPVVWGEAGKTTWYVADGNVVLNGTAGDAVVVTGDVRLVLKDGCVLKAVGSNGAGISVCGAGNAFAVYAQSTNDAMGRLTASAKAAGAGIGTGASSAVDGSDWAGNITINGGVVSATGSPYAAGIGGAGVFDGINASNIVITWRF